uniref:Uncharacterized protein n=1 Tax=Siphoviridae sp. ctsfh5 TaxID=2825697 RepID=A0A8S5PB94_9CAUD|nr:MAG TPA: hypothetical protein [Siphoviridae sp. ctsfh5]
MFRSWYNRKSKESSIYAMFCVYVKRVSSI